MWLQGLCYAGKFTQLFHSYFNKPFEVGLIPGVLYSCIVYVSMLLYLPTLTLGPSPNKFIGQSADRKMSQSADRKMSQSAERRVFMATGEGR